MRRNWPNSARLSTVAGALGCLLLLAACEGDNIFTPVGEPQPPGTPTTPGGTPGVGDTQRPIVDILQPARDSLAKPVGDSVFVEVRVRDNIGVRAVTLFGTSQRGNKDLGTDTVVQRFQGKLVTLDAGVQDTTLTRFLIPTADQTREVVQIIVEASDEAGNVTADTVDLIVGGPDVTFVDIQDGETVRSASTLGVRVRARDPLGILEVSLSTTGILTFNSTVPIPSDADTVVTFDLALPAQSGDFDVVATAVNDLGVESSVGPVTLTAVAGGAGDVVPPGVRHTSSVLDRLELQETITVDVFGRDDAQGDGIRAIGITVLGISGDTVILTDSIVYDPARTGQVTTSFSFLPFNVDPLALPQDMVYEITSWALDAAGNCGAGRGADTLAAETCVPAGATTQSQIQIQGRSGEVLTPTVVAGRTITLPQGGLIMDAAVDTFRQNLYLSNLELNRVEVFDLANEVFLPPIPVGSEPWGMASNACYAVNPSFGCGDTLIVANSGGTNVSFVDLTLLAEDANRRLLTPDVILFEVAVQLDNIGVARYSLSFIPSGEQPVAWSDRPQFIARDSTGTLLFSTKTVDISDPVEIGTVRKVFVPAGGTRTEVVLFTTHAGIVENPDFFAIANVDDIDIFSVATDDEAVIYDHITGTTTLIQSAQDIIENAAIDVAAQGSDIFMATGRWDVEGIGFEDTTFVSSSGDGGWIAIGEGDTEAESRVARILLYDAASGDVTDARPVTDRMLNDGEVVQGIGLNYDGSFGVARGREIAYFFTSDLRLQGITAVEVQGGAGAVLHPLHANARRLDATGSPVGTRRPDTHIAFVPTGESTIDIYDTFHFFRSGRIFIRDVVIGPLRAALPFPGDNTGLTCPTVPVTDLAGNTIGSTVDVFVGDDPTQPYDPTGAGGGAEDQCIVLKLYGPTSGGGVVVVNVRKADILRNHPAR